MSNKRVISPEEAQMTEGSKIKIFERLKKEGWRIGQILVLVDKGKTDEIARHIFQKHDCVESVSLRINMVANVFAEVYYRNSVDLHELIEDIKAMPNVVNVEFSEIIDIVQTRPLDQVLEANA